MNNGGFSAYSYPTSPKQTPLRLRSSLPAEKPHIFSNLGRGNVGAQMALKADQKLVRVFGEAAALRGPVYAHAIGEQRRSQSRHMQRLATPKYKPLAMARDQRPRTDMPRSLGKSQSVPTLNGTLGPMAGRPPLQQSFRLDEGRDMGGHSAMNGNGHSQSQRLRQDLARNFGGSLNGTMGLPSYALGSYDVHQRNQQQGMRERPARAGPTLEALPQARLTTSHPLLPSSWESHGMNKSRSQASLARTMTKTLGQSRSEASLSHTQKLPAKTMVLANVPATNPPVAV